ncbi:MAG: AraC family transcriptional regulator [Pseudoruegeria sp.]
MKLDHVFDSLSIRAEPFALCEIEGICRVALKPEAAVTLHYVLSGSGTISIKDSEPIPIEAGSLVLVPALKRHEVRNNGTVAVPMPECRPAELQLRHVLETADDDPSSKARILALCAHVTIGLEGASNVVELIREPMVFHRCKETALSTIITNLLHELSTPRIGSRAMIRALLLQATIEMLRHRAHSGDRALHWMAALRDPVLWRALKHLLDKPGDAHTVQSLADVSGVSRSVFAQRFANAYGSGPMELLRELRMQRAASLLRTTDLPVKRIAEMVGFASRSAFTRQFETKTGLSPRDYRKSMEVD